MNENALLTWWTNFLHLDGFRVVHVSTDRPTDPVRLTVLPTADVALCPHCQRPCDSIHRRYQSEPVKDLPLGTRPVELIVRTYHHTVCWPSIIKNGMIRSIACVGVRHEGQHQTAMTQPGETHLLLI